ncbi:MAG: DUF1361 domain-containing protein [Chitinophagaceae bacterium]
MFSANYYFLRSFMSRWVWLSIAFSLMLMTVRVVITGQQSYLFLAWNLFLAFIPYCITRLCMLCPQYWERSWLRIVLAMTWLGFLPNSFYIITDLFHLDMNSAAPAWFDLLLLFSFAWNGVVLGILSIRQMEILGRLVWGALPVRLLLLTVMWLCAVGVYIGRYLRYNSWDVLCQPWQLAAEMLHRMIHARAYALMWGMTGLYAIFMLLLYYTIQDLSNQFIIKNKTVYGTNNKGKLVAEK